MGVRNYLIEGVSGAGKTAVKHVVVASMGDLLGFPKGLIVNFVVRTLRSVIGRSGR